MEGKAVDNKRSYKCFTFSAVCFGIAAAVLSIVNPMNMMSLLGVRIAAVICGAASVLMAVLALRLTAPSLGMRDFGKQNDDRRQSVAPPPPALPIGLTMEQACIGSLRGALRALPQFTEKIEQPMVQWQLERIQKALTVILNSCENGPDPAAAVNFATGYLPSVMQYLSACAAEGCPENAAVTLAYAALACEKQQDGLNQEQPMDFREEYAALRTAIEQAGFRWNAE